MCPVRQAYGETEPSEENGYIRPTPNERQTQEIGPTHDCPTACDWETPSKQKKSVHSIERH